MQSLPGQCGAFFSISYTRPETVSLEMVPPELRHWTELFKVDRMVFSLSPHANLYSSSDKKTNYQRMKPKSHMVEPMRQWLSPIPNSE